MCVRKLVLLALLCKVSKVILPSTRDTLSHIICLCSVINFGLNYQTNTVSTSFYITMPFCHYFCSSVNFVLTSNFLLKSCDFGESRKLRELIALWIAAVLIEECVPAEVGSLETNIPHKMDTCDPASRWRSFVKKKTNKKKQSKGFNSIIKNINKFLK